MAELKLNHLRGEEDTMFTPMFSPNLLLELHRGRERELLAKARESQLLNAAKNARLQSGAEANRPRPQDRVSLEIGSLLVSFGLWLKNRVDGRLQRPASNDTTQAA